MTLLSRIRSRNHPWGMPNVLLTMSGNWLYVFCTIGGFIGSVYSIYSFLHTNLFVIKWSWCSRNNLRALENPERGEPAQVLIG